MTDSHAKTKLTLPAKILIIGILNFFSFLVFSLIHEGDGLNAGVAEGRYFLVNHGKSLKVGPVLHYYSCFQAISVIITHLLLFITAVVTIGQPKDWSYTVPLDGPNPVPMADTRFWGITLAILVGLPAFIELVAHPPRARPIEHRLIYDRPQALSKVQRLNEAAGPNVASISPEEMFPYPAPKESRGDVDGDGIEDVMTRYTDVNIGLECSNTTGSQTLFRGEERGRVMASGIDDVDLDGNKDLWWIDAGEYFIRIYFGDGKGAFPCKQLIRTRGNYLITGGFVDIDGDGDLDIVAKAFCSTDCKCSNGSGDCWRWIELEPVKRRPSPP